MSKSEFESMLKEVGEEQLKARRHKVMLYLTESLYYRFKVRCEAEGQNVSTLVEAFMRRVVESQPDEQLDKKADKEFRERLKSRSE